MTVPDEQHGRIGVVGAGSIGIGVAQCLAQSGLSVTLVDVTTSVLEQARKNILLNLRLAQLLGLLSRGADLHEVLERIEFVLTMEPLRAADIVIENVPERWSAKEPVYRQLDVVCPTDSVLAANTSAVSVARIARVTSRPDRVVGVHFMNPVPSKPTVEVVRSEHTSSATLGRVDVLLRRMGKRSVVVNDSPGFVSNRVLMISINEAIRTAHDRVASPEDIDKIFVQCFDHKMGPLATADLIGLDTVLDTLHVLSEAYPDGRFSPCPLLEKMVEEGHHGRKSGKGFFEYPTT